MIDLSKASNRKIIASTGRIVQDLRKHVTHESIDLSFDMPRNNTNNRNKNDDELFGNESAEDSCDDAEDSDESLSIDDFLNKLKSRNGNTEKIEKKKNFEKKLVPVPSTFHYETVERKSKEKFVSSWQRTSMVNIEEGDWPPLAVTQSGVRILGVQRISKIDVCGVGGGGKRDKRNIAMEYHERNHVRNDRNNHNDDDRNNDRNSNRIRASGIPTPLRAGHAGRERGSEHGSKADNNNHKKQIFNSANIDNLREINDIGDIGDIGDNYGGNGRGYIDPLDALLSRAAQTLHSTSGALGASGVGSVGGVSVVMTREEGRKYLSARAAVSGAGGEAVVAKLDVYGDVNGDTGNDADVVINVNNSSTDNVNNRNITINRIYNSDKTNIGENNGENNDENNDEIGEKNDENRSLGSAIHENIVRNINCTRITNTDTRDNYSISRNISYRVDNVSGNSCVCGEGRDAPQSTENKRSPLDSRIIPKIFSFQC